jgi:glycosyltransferase involved in cell wall biosynthesis
MRICQVCGEFYETGAGGIGTYVYRLSQNLVSLGHDVDIIAYDTGRPKYGADEEFTVYKTPLSRVPIWRNFSWGRNAAALVGKLHNKKRYDVVHVHLRGAMGYPLFHKVKVPVVSTFHNMYRERCRFVPVRYRILEYLKLLEDSLSAGKSDMIIGINRPIIIELEKSGISRDKITYVPNATDTSYFAHHTKDRKTIREGYGIGIGEDEFLVLFVGRLDQQKGLEYLIGAASRLDKRFKILIVGEGLEKYKRHLLNMAHGIENIIFTGALYGEDLKEVYAASDIFVLPSLYEGFPTVLLEAMASGLPIVASDIPSTRSIVKSDFGVLITPRDPGKLADAILKLDDKKALREMGKKSVEESKRYDWDIITKKIVNVYRELAGGYK